MIRTASRALLIQNDHVLAVKYREEGRVFFALPGGGQETFEPLHNNLRRECLEELGIDVQIGELIFVREWIDEERNIHQIEFIFECSSFMKIEDVKGEIPDGGQIGIEWLPIANIMNYHLYPLEMREELQKLAQGHPKIPVYLGKGN